MKATLTCLLLSLITLTSSAQTVFVDAAPFLRRLTPPPVVPATHASKENPVAEMGKFTAILMADGSEQLVRDVWGVSTTEIRVMTNDGVTGIPFESLHPATQVYFQPQIEKSKLDQAKAAAAAEENRALQAIQDKIDAEYRREFAAKKASEDEIKAQQQAAAAEAKARQQADYLQRLQIVEAEARATAAYLASEQAARDSIAAQKAADPRALATARRIEQARVAYQQQLQAQELQIFNALVETQQIELLRRLGYLR